MEKLPHKDQAMAGADLAKELSAPEPGNRVGFEAAKRNYFTQLAVHLKGELALHRSVGLWERNEAGERDWGNVSEHCLVEAARAREFSELLDLPADVEADLISAAGLHDFYKKGEAEIVRAQGLEWQSFERASAESSRLLHEAGFSDRVARLAAAVGHGSLLETERILEQPELSQDDLAFLVMHYIDDFTVGSDWAQAAEVTDGQKRNSLDQRVDKNEANERYRVIEEEGRKVFNGRTTFQAQRAIGEQVEARLGALVASRTGETLDPKDLPIFIDDQIRTRITAEATA